MELRDATREAEQAREARTAEQITAAAGPLAEEQEDLVFRTDDVIQDIRELPEGEFEFEREIQMLRGARAAMDEAFVLLDDELTGRADGRRGDRGDRAPPALAPLRRRRWRRRRLDPWLGRERRHRGHQRARPRGPRHRRQRGGRGAGRRPLDLEGPRPGSRPSSSRSGPVLRRAGGSVIHGAVALAGAGVLTLVAGVPALDAAAAFRTRSRWAPPRRRTTPRRRSATLASSRASTTPSRCCSTTCSAPWAPTWAAQRARLSWASATPTSSAASPTSTTSRRVGAGSSRTSWPGRSGGRRCCRRGPRRSATSGAFWRAVAASAPSRLGSSSRPCCSRRRRGCVLPRWPRVRRAIEEWIEVGPHAARSPPGTSWRSC